MERFFKETQEKLKEVVHVKQLQRFVNAFKEHQTSISENVSTLKGKIELLKKISEEKTRPSERYDKILQPVEDARATVTSLEAALKKLPYTVEKVEKLIATLSAKDSVYKAAEEDPMDEGPIKDKDPMYQSESEEDPMDEDPMYQSANQYLKEYKDAIKSIDTAKDTIAAAAQVKIECSIM